MNVVVSLVKNVPFTRSRMLISEVLLFALAKMDELLLMIIFVGNSGYGMHKI